MTDAKIEWSLKENLKGLWHFLQEDVEKGGYVGYVAIESDIETLRQKVIDEFRDLIIDCSILFFKDRKKEFDEWISDKEDTELIPFVYRGISVHAYHDFIERINKLFGVSEKNEEN